MLRVLTKTPDFVSQTDLITCIVALRFSHRPGIEHERTETILAADRFYLSPTTSTVHLQL